MSMRARLIDSGYRYVQYRQMTGRALRTALCADCHAKPCDCNDPIWTYAFRRSGEKAHLQGSILRIGGKLQLVGGPRSTIARALDEKKRSAPQEGFDFGPIQRLTNPVHVFPGAMPTDVCTTYDCLIHATCKLRWCGRPAPYDSHCSDRCREYDEQQRAIRDRCETFLARHRALCRAHPARMSEVHTEIFWATQKRNDELDVVERQFRALRVEV
jgi:hypothetical protein